MQLFVPLIVSGRYVIGKDGNAFYGVAGMKAHVLQLAGMSQSCAQYLNGQVISVTAAYGIDTKIDDGLADSGNVFTIRGEVAAGCGTSTGCTTNNYTSPTASYVLNDSSQTTPCRMLFWLDKTK